MVQEGSLGSAKDHMSKYHLLFIPVGTSQGDIQVLIDIDATREFISVDCAKILVGKTFQNQKMRIELTEGSQLMPTKRKQIQFKMGEWRFRRQL